MNDRNSTSGLPGDDSGASANDVDPRFDDAAVGTAPPRPEASTTTRPAQEQLADIVAQCSEWVRGKPMQAIAIAASIGFLLGRSGR